MTYCYYFLGKQRKQTKEQYEHTNVVVTQLDWTITQFDLSQKTQKQHGSDINKFKSELMISKIRKKSNQSGKRRNNKMREEMWKNIYSAL